jgi:Chromate transport protein ChrA
MNLLALYLLILKATITSFNGPSSLPILRDEMVVKHHLISDRQLNAAVVAGRTAPGPMGIYVVSVGYYVAGLPGACAGLLAMITPALLIVPLIRYVGHRAEHPKVRRTLDAVVLAGAGLTLASTQPLAVDALTGLVPAAIACASLALLLSGRLQTAWIIVGSALAGLFLLR